MELALDLESLPYKQAAPLGLHKAITLPTYNIVQPRRGGTCCNPGLQPGEGNGRGGLRATGELPRTSHHLARMDGLPIT